MIMVNFFMIKGRIIIILNLKWIFFRSFWIVLDIFGGEMMLVYDVEVVYIILNVISCNIFMGKILNTLFKKE